MIHGLACVFLSAKDAFADPFDPYAPQQSDLNVAERTIVRVDQNPDIQARWRRCGRSMTTALNRHADGTSQEYFIRS
jgi:hypothetical protein